SDCAGSMPSSALRATALQIGTLKLASLALVAVAIEHRQLSSVATAQAWGERARLVSWQTNVYWSAIFRDRSTRSKSRRRSASGNIDGHRRRHWRRQDSTWIVLGEHWLERRGAARCALRPDESWRFAASRPLCFTPVRVDAR